MKKISTILMLSLFICQLLYAEWIDPQNLKVGERYEISEEIPLMPELNPVYPLIALEKRKAIKAGSTFKIIKIGYREHDTKHLYPWYFSEVIDPEGNVYRGWINCQALMGQDIKKSRSKNSSRNKPLRKKKTIYRVLRNPSPAESEPVLLVKDKSTMDKAVGALALGGIKAMNEYVLTAILEGKTFTVSPNTKCKIIEQWGDLYSKVEIMEGKNKGKIGFILGGLIH